MPLPQLDPPVHSPRATAATTVTLASSPTPVSPGWCPQLPSSLFHARPPPHDKALVHPSLLLGGQALSDLRAQLASLVRSRGPLPCGKRQRSALTGLMETPEVMPGSCEHANTEVPWLASHLCLHSPSPLHGLALQLLGEALGKVLHCTGPKPDPGKWVGSRE